MQIALLGGFLPFQVLQRRVFSNQSFELQLPVQQQQPSSISSPFSSSAYGAGDLIIPALAHFSLFYLSIDTIF
jgi:hypothetical protein